MMPAPEAEPDGDPDGGAVEEACEESGPERRCVVSGQVRPRGEMLRFVVGPDGAIHPDPAAQLPGRGIWLSPRRDVVNTAVTKRLFARAARRAVVVPDDLADRVEALLARRCLDALGLARRAGQAVAGFEKVCAEVRAGRAALLFAARDAGHDGCDKVRALAGRGGKGVPLVGLFDGAELGGVFGRDLAVHVSVAPGGLAGRLCAAAGLLSGFRPGLFSVGGDAAENRSPEPSGD